MYIEEIAEVSEDVKNDIEKLLISHIKNYVHNNSEENILNNKFDKEAYFSYENTGT